MQLGSSRAFGTVGHTRLIAPVVCGMGVGVGGYEHRCIFGNVPMAGANLKGGDLVSTIYEVEGARARVYVFMCMH